MSLWMRAVKDVPQYQSVVYIGEREQFTVGMHLLYQGERSGFIGRWSKRIHYLGGCGWVFICGRGVAVLGAVRASYVSSMMQWSRTRQYVHRKSMQHYLWYCTRGP